MRLKYFVIFLFSVKSYFTFYAVNVKASKQDCYKKVEHAHLAGSWYPENKAELKKELDYYFSLAKNNFKIINGDSKNVVALIVPHAGYYFSGLCAASAYQAINGVFKAERLLKESTAGKNIFDSHLPDRVIIIGSSHTSAFNGIALPNFDYYKTPMGSVEVDKGAISELASKSSLFKVTENLWQQEHCIEIQLPYLQYCLDKFSIVPLIVGNLQEKDFELAARAICQLLSDNEKFNASEKTGANEKLESGQKNGASKKTLLVISSDFIHYGAQFSYTPVFSDVAKFDSMAISAIKNRSFADFDSAVKKTGATICGKEPIKILLKLIQMGFMGQVEPELTCYYNSLQLQESREGKKIDVTKLLKLMSTKGDGEQKTLGISESSVSYAGIIFRSQLTRKEEQILLSIARGAIKNKLFSEKTSGAQDNLGNFAEKASFGKNNFGNNFGNNAGLDNLCGNVGLPELMDNVKITDNLKKKSGVFVTLKTKDGDLRGCIGTIFGREPLYKSVAALALSSAFADSRFAPLKKQELENIVIDITVLTPAYPVKSYNDIIIGKHGIILEKTVNGQVASAVFLPQVPGEFGWDLAQTLSHLSQKAGLDKDAWKRGCKFKVFEGFEFSEQRD